MIKIGTSSLIDVEGKCVRVSSMARIAELAGSLSRHGHRTVIVSSGAVGVGCLRMGIAKRPTSLPGKQAVAACGQVQLMRHWDSLLSTQGLACAQVLLTAGDIASRSQYLNARATFHQLIRRGAVPVVNENDSVSVEQLRYGDNDTLSAQVAALVEANALFLLTDVDALYTANPSRDPTAVRISETSDIQATMREVDTDGGKGGTAWGTGGMATKLTAATIATASGCDVVVSSSDDIDFVYRWVMRGDRSRGTTFNALQGREVASGRRRWVLSVPVADDGKAALVLDAGAAAAILARRKSLFSKGIVEVQGTFARDSAVRLLVKEDPAEARSGVAPSVASPEDSSAASIPPTPGGRLTSRQDAAPIVYREIARCLINFPDRDLRKLVEHQTADKRRSQLARGETSVHAVLGYHGPDEVANREHISRVAPSRAPTPALLDSPDQPADAGRAGGEGAAEQPVPSVTGMGKPRADAVSTASVRARGDDYSETGSDADSAGDWVEGSLSGRSVAADPSEMSMLSEMGRSRVRRGEGIHGSVANLNLEGRQGAGGRPPSR